MKKLNLTALLLGAALFTGLGVTSASAEGMKCGAGKCGKGMIKPIEAEGKCGVKKDDAMEAGKCGAEKKAAMEAGKCGTEKKDAMEAKKCGSNK